MSIASRTPAVRDAVITAELRPPRAELATGASMDAWIDTYHAVKGLTRNDTFVFLTDSAVGLKEEDNLRHLVSNMGSDVPRSSVVPFLTTKHPLEYCLAYADRAYQHGFESLVVLGGDKSVGPPRCVEHAWQLREHIRRHQPGLALGGWANPHATAANQVGYLLDERRQRRVLPDADRVASQPARRRPVPRGSRPSRALAAGTLRRLLLPIRQREDPRHPPQLPAGPDRRADARVRGRRDRRRDLRPLDSAI